MGRREDRSRMETGKRRCYLGGEKKFDPVKGKVRDLPGMPILKCRRCELVFLENFDHIDDRFYEESRMCEKEPISDWKQYLKECAVNDTRIGYLIWCIKNENLSR